MSKVKANNICLNIFSSLSHLELLQYDVLKGQFLKVDSVEIMFDPATRDFLEDASHFKSAVLKLYQRNKIPTRIPATLVVPSFFTREYEVPETVEGEDIATILISEAERFYVFKKIDPAIGYINLKDNRLLYTAYPKGPLELIQQYLTELKIPLISIDCNYTAIVRGLVAMGVVQEEITNQVKWGLIIINDYNVFLAVVEGNLIEKIRESPLPLQNMEENALLAEVKGDFKEFFGYEILTRMVIVNNSFKVYSPLLVEMLEFQGPTDIFDQNQRTLNSLGAQEGPFPCSLEAAGGALVHVLPQVPALELFDTNKIQVFVDEERQNLIAYSLIGLGVLLFVMQFALGFLLSYLTDTETAQGARLQNDINSTLSSLAIVPEVKRKLFVKNGILQNYKINNLMIEMHRTLPPDAWLTEVSLKSSPDFKNLDLAIKGGSLSPDSLNAYVKELNKEVGTPALVPSVFPKQADNKQRYFEFSLTNATLPGGRP